MASTRSEFPEDVLDIDQSPGSHIGIGVPEGLMEGGTVGVIQPVAGVKRKELHFSAVRKTRRFVHNEPPGFDRSLDGHEGSVPLDRPPNKALHPTPPSSLPRRGRSRVSADVGPTNSECRKQSDSGRIYCMSTDEIEAAALKLEPRARARLAGRLLESLDELSPDENARLWAEEAQRRADALDAGSLSSRSSEDVFRDAQNRI